MKMENLRFIQLRTVKILSTKYYDWQKTLSFNADITMVITARGMGKTYGLRKQCVKDFLKDGSRFVEITRFKNELTGVADGYFSKLVLNKEFPNYIFKTEGKKGYIARQTQQDLKNNVKPEWELICYFVALSDMQAMKKRTFVNVYRIIMDESILDFNDRFHRYLPNEWNVLANMVDSVSRENTNETRLHPPKLYLLANACDLINPYFTTFQINEPPNYGYTWYYNKTFLLHYMEPGEYAENKLTKTLAGKMFSLTNEKEMAAGNKFLNADTDFIERKSSNAEYQFAIKANGLVFAVWEDNDQGLLYITSKIPRKTDKPVYALTYQDNKIDYVAVEKNSLLLRSLVDLYYSDCLRYESIALREQFLTTMKLYGIH